MQQHAQPSSSRPVTPRDKNGRPLLRKPRSINTPEPPWRRRTISSEADPGRPSRVELHCYATQYPDLFKTYCPRGHCNYARLANHHRMNAQAENRHLCFSPPPPPPPPAYEPACAADGFMRSVCGLATTLEGHTLGDALGPPSAAFERRVRDACSLSSHAFAPSAPRHSRSRGRPSPQAVSDGGGEEEGVGGYGVRHTARGERPLPFERLFISYAYYAPEGQRHKPDIAQCVLDGA